MRPPLHAASVRGRGAGHSEDRRVHRRARAPTRSPQTDFVTGTPDALKAAGVVARLTVIQKSSPVTGQ
jgi:hypothetical protein